MKEEGCDVKSGNSRENGELEQCTSINDEKHTCYLGRTVTSSAKGQGAACIARRLAALSCVYG